jgi:CheY-like chemotaxis protein
MSESPTWKSILVVEDDAANRDSTVLLLRVVGYDARGARNGREALDLLRVPPRPDLIVLDLWMPVLDGWQFRRRQLADPALAPIPVLVLSAVADEARGDGSFAGVSILAKPADPHDLFAAVARLVGGAFAAGGK